MWLRSERLMWIRFDIVATPVDSERNVSRVGLK
jgi:hypothetical protein